MFAPEPEAPTPTYSLLSLPPSLVALLSDPETAHSLEIRGHTTDAAVLVSGTKTYSLRGVQNSNSLCLCSLPDSGPEGKGWFAREQDDDECEVKDGAIEIQTVLHETLEVVQGVARTDRLEGLLRGSEYRGEDGEQSNTLVRPLTSSVAVHAFSFCKLTRPLAQPDSKQTSTTLKSLLPASDTEISTALRRHRVITLDGYLRPLPPSYLLTILPSLLSAISPAKAEDAEEESMPEAQPRHDVKPGFSKKDRKKAKAAPAAAEAVKETLVTADSDDLLSALDAVDCGEEVARQLLAWFGKEQKGDRWELRVREVVRETGIGLLEEGGVSAVGCARRRTLADPDLIR